MKKDTSLINIYLKIHNKRSITLDDLRYLAQYDSECFEKTCKNVVYNIPETKTIMETAPPDGEVQEEAAEDLLDSKPSGELERFGIEKILDNLKRMETKELPIANIDVEKVKNLLGNLYMELLFPHNDEETFISAAYEAYDTYEKGTASFDKKA